jgi:eukaryotic-like serine/threonine-protein kinase
MSAEEEQRLYEFEGFRLVARRRLLFGPHGEAIPLKPRVLETLRYLVEHPGQLLDKVTLMRAVWGNAIVDENGLSQHISTLRQAFGEKPGENRFIATVQGRGYVFVAPVRSHGIETSRDAAKTAAGADEPRDQERVRRRLGLLGAAAALIIAAAMALSFMQLDRPSSASQHELGEQIVHLSLELPAGQRLTGGVPAEDSHGQRPSRPSFALSPDARQLVFAAFDGTTRRLFRRRLNEPAAVAIPGTEGANQPFFSPDGRSIGFVTDGKLRAMPAEGGEVRTVTVAALAVNDQRFTPSWGSDGTILFATQRGIFEVPVSGGAETQLTESGSLPTDGLHLFPQRLPDGAAVLFNVANDVVPSRWDIVVELSDGSERKVLVQGGSHPHYVGGRILFARGGALLAVPFDAERLTVTGDPVVVVEDVMHGEGGSSDSLNFGAAQYDVSASGVLAYAPGGIYPVRRKRLLWADRGGAFEPVPLLPEAPYFWPRFSPDGKRLSFGIGGFGDMQIWVYDIERETRFPVMPAHTGDNAVPAWSPDGKQLAYTRPEEGLFVIAADGSGQSQRVLEGGWPQPSSWSKDGVIAYVGEAIEYGDPPLHVGTVHVDDTRGSKPLLESRAPSAWPDFSPDGQWIAYAKVDEEAGRVIGRYEIYVQAFPGGAPHRISTAGGIAPVWSRDQRQLYYRHVVETGTTQLMVVDVETAPDFKAGPPRLLFTTPNASASTPVRSYDISPDGERFVFLSSPIEPTPQPVTSIDIVLHWFDELDRLVPHPPSPASAL